MKVTGKITLIKERETGVTKSEKGWSKVAFLLETKEEYNNLYCFNIFAMDEGEKNNVENFVKFNKVGQEVDVEFNVKTTEWKGKHFTELAAWKIFKAEAPSPALNESEVEEDDLPF
tara:strand:- start:809 stop:1156 length:348 start_codon:yes stop_codon:yes gene_type:complete